MWRSRVDWWETSSPVGRCNRSESSVCDSSWRHYRWLLCFWVCELSLNFRFLWTHNHQSCCSEKESQYRSGSCHRTRTTQSLSICQADRCFRGLNTRRMLWCWWSPHHYSWKQCKVDLFDHKSRSNQQSQSMWSQSSFLNEYRTLELTKDICMTMQHLMTPGSLDEIWHLSRWSRRMGSFRCLSPFWWAPDDLHW